MQTQAQKQEQCMILSSLRLSKEESLVLALQTTLPNQIGMIVNNLIYEIAYHHSSSFGLSILHCLTTREEFAIQGFSKKLFDV